MSRLTATQKSYETLAKLLDEALRARRRPAKELEEVRESLNVAFYLLGWAQFEYLVRKEAEQTVEEMARSKTVDGHAWNFMKDNIKTVTVRKRLDVIFHSDRSMRSRLDGEYTVRNDAAHNYKILPKEAKDVSQWIRGLEEIVSKFKT